MPSERRGETILGGSEKFRTYSNSWTVRSTIFGRPRTGQARALFCLLHYARPLEPFAACGVYKCIKENPSCVVLYATSKSPAELTYLALPTSTRPRSRYRFSHSILLQSSRLGSLRYQRFCAFVDLVFLGVLLFVFSRILQLTPVFHASRLLSSCTVGHTARLASLPLRLSVACSLRSPWTVFALS